MKQGWYWWRHGSETGKTLGDPIPRFVSWGGGLDKRMYFSQWIVREIGTGKLVSVDHELGDWGPYIEWPSDEDFQEVK